MRVLMRGGGDLASAVAYTLKRSGFDIVIIELEQPLVIRRSVSFASAVTENQMIVEGVKALNVKYLDDIDKILALDAIVVTVLNEKEVLEYYKPDVFIDATLSKKSVAYKIGYAPLVIGLGPNITAGVNADYVIETNRGHHLGRIIEAGIAQVNTGVPGMIGGYSTERVHYSFCAGKIKVIKNIGDVVKAGKIIATIGDAPVVANIDGVLRGMLKEGTQVKANMKIADVDPRADSQYCHTISDKGRTIAGATLEAIMRRYNYEGKF